MKSKICKHGMRNSIIPCFMCDLEYMKKDPKRRKEYQTLMKAADKYLKTRKNHKI